MTRKKRKFAGKLIPLKIISAIVLIYILAPIVILVISSFAVEDYLTITPSGFTLRWYKNFFNTPGFTNAFWISIQLAFIATFGALLLGTISAYALDKSKKRDFLIGYFGSPLLIPQIIIALALMQVCNMLGIPRAMPLLVAGHILVAMPYVVRTVTAALYRFNSHWEEASFTMGANKFKTMWHITLPILKPSMIASGCFAFITSFGNLSLSVFLTTARFTTLPIRLYSYARHNADPTIAAISATTLLLTVVLMAVIDKLVGIENMY